MIFFLSSPDARPPYGFMLLPGTTSSGFAMKRSSFSSSFLTKAPAKDARDKVAAVAKDYEPFTFAGQEVYVNYSQGLGRSKLAEKFSDIIGVSSTVRNIRTVEKVLELAPAALSEARRKLVLGLRD